MRNLFGDKPRHRGIHREKTMPSGDFGAHSEIEILAERIARPAAGRHDRRAAPDPAGAVELKQPAGAIARRLFHDEMGVEHQTLRAGQPIRPVVCEFATRLHEARAWIGDQGRDDRPQPIRRRPEIGVENGDIGCIRASKASSQGARLVALPSRTAKVGYIVAMPAQLPNDSAGNRGRLVGTVVEKLEMQLFAGPIEGRRGSQAVFDHRGFVKNRDLHENMGKVGFANQGCRKRLAEQPAGRLLKNIDANEKEKAAANK